MGVQNFEIAWEDENVLDTWFYSPRQSTMRWLPIASPHSTN